MSGLFIMAVGLLIILCGKSVVLLQGGAAERLSQEASWKAGTAGAVIIVRVLGGLTCMFGLLVATA